MSKARFFSLRRTWVTVALVAMTTLALAHAANAATLGSGKVTLTFSKKFAKTLRSAKTKVKGKSGPSVKGRTVTLSASGGSGALASPYSENLTLVGSVDFKRGKRTQRFSKLKASLRNKSGSLKSGRSSIFSVRTSGKYAARAGFTGLDLRKSSLKLTRAGAKALNKKLRTKKFKKNMSMGSLKSAADRTVSFVNGSTRIALDNGTMGKFTSCGVTLSAVAPATSTPPPPNMKLTLPIGEGTLTANTLRGTVHQTGGVHLEKSSPPHSSDLTQFELDLGAPGGSSFSALASDIGNGRVPIGPIDDAGQNRQATLTATGGTVTVTGGTLRLSATAAGLLAGNFGCTTVAANDPLGAIEQLTGQVQ